MSTAPRSRWGPSHQTRAPLFQKPTWFRTCLTVLLFVWYPLGPTLASAIVILGGGTVVLWILDERRASRNQSSDQGNIAADPDPYGALLDRGRQLGAGGVYLGTDGTRRWRFARPERGVLLLGPPRSGKTSAVIIPALLAHPGPVVSTSTKPDVLDATAHVRSRLARVWRFDPGAHGSSGVCELRWSPVTAARSWDGALMIARAMVTGAGVGTGTTDQSHWSKRATALLAPLLHAAAMGGKGMDRVLHWVLRHELDEPGALLHTAGAELACGVLTGLQNTEARERSSIFSAAADALEAYASASALAATHDPNFDADQFVRSRETIYIHAPGEAQQLAAPLVCGLLAEIRQATYRAHRERGLHGRVLFALDEAANIAPLAELPQIASEGGGQGLTLLAAFQDLSQARARWGPAADGFLTLFGAKLILPGVADPRTLEAVSVSLGEYDRQVISETRGRGRDPFSPNRSHTISTQRQRVLSPGEVANIPAGHGLHLDGVRWELLTLTPAHCAEPWRTITSRLRSPGAMTRIALGRLGGRLQHHRCVECMPAGGGVLRHVLDGGVLVLTVAKITAGGAGSYAEYLDGRSQPAELGDYYLKDGERVEAQGRWAGGALALGADPAKPVSGEVLRTLMAVRRPDNGEALRRVGGNGLAVAALDATFSAPKSVSAIWALGSSELRVQIERAHERAIDRSLAYATRTVPMMPKPGRQQHGDPREATRADRDELAAHDSSRGRWSPAGSAASFACAAARRGP